MQNTAFEKNQLQVRAGLLVFDVVNQTVQDQRLAELWQTCDPSEKALAALKAVIQHLRKDAGRFQTGWRRVHYTVFGLLRNVSLKNFGDGDFGGALSFAESVDIF